MRADLSKPVSGIPRIRLLPVQNAVPETAFPRVQILAKSMAFIETGEIKPESAQGPLRTRSVGKQVERRKQFERPLGLLAGAVSTGQRHQSLTILIERQNGRRALAVSYWIKSNCQLTIVPDGKILGNLRPEGGIE